MPSVQLLRSVVEQAVLAPSSHNTQPRRVRIDGRQLELYLDRSRALAVNDPRDRELTISCGAALLNARVAAEHAGTRLDISLLPDGEDADLLARTALAGDGAGDESLYAAIAERRTYRKHFADGDVRGRDARCARRRGGRGGCLRGGARRRQARTLRSRCRRG